MKRGIASTLVSVGSLILLATITVIGLIAYRESALSLNELEAEQLESRASTIAAGISRVLGEEEKLLKALADNSLIRDSLSAGLISAEGEPSLPEDLLRQELSRFQMIAPEEIQDCLLFDRTGRYVSGTDDSFTEGEVSRTGYVTKALKGITAYGEPEESSRDSGHFIPLSSPVTGGNNEVLGCLVIHVNFELIQEQIRDEKIGDTGYAFVIDREGRVIAHPDDGEIFTRNLNKTAGMETLAEEMLSGSKGIIQYLSGVIEKTAGYAPIGETGWGIALTIPDSEFLHPAHRIKWIIVTAGIISFLATFLIFMLFARSLTGPIIASVQFAEKISEGLLNQDLNAHLFKRKDETGKLALSLTEMKNRLVQIIGDVNSAAIQVHEGSRELNKSAQALSSGVSSQASSIEEISASMEEMNATISQNASNANETEEKAKRSTEMSRQSDEAVQKTVDAMNIISNRISLIQEIARNINLLALNASIEAARAGEYGKGFMVVASEVGKLADRSKNAADEIEKITAEGVSMAEEAGRQMKAMLPETMETAALVQEISSSCNEQAAGAQEISEALITLDHVIQENAAFSEESASMSEELENQADLLKEAMGFFTIDSSAVKIASPREKRKQSLQAESGQTLPPGRERLSPGRALPASEKRREDSEFIEF